MKRSIFILLIFICTQTHAQKTIRNFVFGNSLINHEFQTIITPSQETSVPHWFHFLAEESNRNYAMSGQYGFLPQHQNLPPIAQWGFDFVPFVWDSDNELFSDANFTNILITPGNFIQDQGPNEHYFNEDFSPVDATENIFNWCRAEEPGMTYYIYENWPDMAGFLGSGFPPNETEWAAYNDYLNNDFHQWFLDYHNQVQQRIPDLCIKMIPVGTVISQLLQTSPFDEIEVTTLYEDDAPHGRPTIYFLAALTTYMAMYEERAPSSYEVTEFIDPIIADNYNLVVDFIWSELLAFDDASGTSLVFCNEPDMTTDVAIIVAEDNIELLPNPTTDQFTINGPLAAYEITILDVNGQLVQSFNEEGTALTIDISNLPVGLFFVNITNKDNGDISVELILKQ